MRWLPKFVVCLSYYDRFRFRSDAFAALFLALQIFPLAIAIPVATGVPPLYGVLCAATAGLLASVFGDSKIRVTAPNVVFVAVASSIVAREGILGLSLSTLLAGVLLVFFGALGLGAGIRVLPRPVVIGFATGIAVLVISQHLIIWLLQQAPISSVECGPTGVPQDASPVSVRLCHGGGLPEVFGGLSLAGWVHLPSMRARKILRIGEPTAPPMRQVSAPDFADIWDHSSPDEDSADPLVLGGVSDDH
jgi:hypothetical protein